MTNSTNKDPLIHFPFYINQYQGLLAGYSFLEKGAFIALLCVYLSEDGQIPKDINKLYRMAGAFNEEEQVALSSIKDEIIRVGLDILKNQKKVREKSREKATKAANKRWSKPHATSITEALLEDCQTETETETDINKEKETEKKTDNKNIIIQFESFWNLYNHKKVKPKALAAYQKALKSDTHDNIILGVSAYLLARGNDPQYWKHPTTWLNGECWKDEHTPSPKNNSGAAASALSTYLKNR